MAPARLALFVALCALAGAALASSHEVASLNAMHRKLMQKSRGTGVEPRYGIAEIDAMDDNDPYKLVMIAAWMEMTSSEERSSVHSYWRLAGIHGKKWAYNDVDAPAEGFCKHRQPAFGPWHRAYMKMYENALIEAAESAVSAITDSSVRKSALAVAKTIRLPFWDWTASTIPGILTARTVACYQTDGSVGECRNPFLGYEYLATAGTGRTAGGKVRRASNWQGAMRGSASTFARQMSSFVRSNNWRCTYTGASTCFGNLEQVHNDIHNIMGGTAGDMATIEFAGFDPVFWLHHCMLDRALWLFQSNGGAWSGARAPMSPFQTLAGDTSQPTTLGYTYGAGGSGRPAPREREEDDGEEEERRPSRRSRSSRRSWAELEESDSPASSAAAKAAVKVALEEWTGNYTGYQWAVRFQELNDNQLDKVAHVYVFLNTPEATASIEALPARIEEYNELRVKPNYCGSASGFNDYNLHAMHAAGVAPTQNRAVDLTDCLLKAGVNTDVAAAVAADPARGPSKAPVKLADLKIIAVNSDGEDVTSKFDFGKPVISWSLPVSRTLGQARAAVAAQDPSDAAALASVAADFNADEAVFSAVHGDFP